MIKLKVNPFGSKFTVIMHPSIACILNIILLVVDFRLTVYCDSNPLSLLVDSCRLKLIPLVYSNWQNWLSLWILGERLYDYIHVHNTYWQNEEDKLKGVINLMNSQKKKKPKQYWFLVLKIWFLLLSRGIHVKFNFFHHEEQTTSKASTF